MSEFTTGNLFLTKHADAVRAALEAHVPLYKVKQLDARWSVALAPGFAPLPEISQAAPILHFVNAEDHGWSYGILHQGATVAAVEVYYELEYPDQFPLANVEAFGLFEIDQAAIDRLREVLSPAYAGKFQEQAEEFKACLGIAEMSWISYDYLDGEE